MKYTLSFLCLCLFPLFTIGHEEREFPMPIPHEQSIVHTWLQKEVHETQLLDDMEDFSSWEHRGAGNVTITDELAKSGQHSIKMTCPTFTDHPSQNGRPPASCVAWFKVDRENWSESNRLSFWVYPKMPGFRAIPMSVVLHNEGTLLIPDQYGRLGRNFFMLENEKWNHIVWEIAHLSRDEVIGVEFMYRMQGNEPGAANTACYYLDQLELQTVTPDHYEGWNVAPDKIAYSHTGYPVDGEKIALVSQTNADHFTLRNAENNESVLRLPVKKIQTEIGEFVLLDFSEFNKPGLYVLKVGDLKTKPFALSENVWDETIWKTINCFYGLRCGMEIPGIHGTCHEDWLTQHEDKKITYNGGWHDAGDLSQGLRNTCEAAYAMFLLAENLQPSSMRERLLEEAKWGLDWIMKNRFGDGYRCRWGTMDFWTDNIIGTVDDMITDNIVNDPYHNFHASAAQAIASRLLKESNPYMARRALKYAEEDWGFALEELDRERLEPFSIGVIASLELYQSTGDNKYAEKAAELAQTIMACQQQTKPDWDIPLAGFFYRSPAKRRIQHYAHIGEIQLPITALVMLCELCPEHSDSKEWKHSVQLYNDYLKTIASYTEPYSMFPASIYSFNESNDDRYKEQVLEGIQLSDEYYLRRFPVWYDFRGNYGVMLSQARALASTARLLNDDESLQLVYKQLEWVVGLNPFCQSTMYGEGHDFAPQYSATSGDIVGGLPVGVQSNRHYDKPFWPSDNCYNFKEIWVHPSSRWLAIMADLNKIQNE